MDLNDHDLDLHEDSHDGAHGDTACRPVTKCSCSCGSSRCKNKCVQSNQPKKWLTRYKLRVGSDNLGVAIDTKHCGYSDSEATPSMYIRRRGDSKWLLAYDAQETDDDNRYVFQFDSQLLSLRSGRYEGQIRFACEPCGSIEIDLTNKCALDVTSIKAVPKLDLHVLLDKPPGVTDMYESVVGFKTTICSKLSSSSIELPLSDADAADLCAKLVSVCKTVQVIISDNIKSEIVTITECLNGIPIIDRGADGTTPKNFPAGSNVQFTWTESNVKNACEGC